MDSLERQDIVWFNYTHQEESERVRNEFVGELISQFPQTQVENIHDRVNGIGLRINNLALLGESRYYAWVIAHSYYSLSQALSKMMTMEEHKPKLDYCISLAKQEYPDKWRI
ncbi:MAG: hypothetical protein P8J32_03620 [bacterium]|nr:hypothetical protein [bacterium]